MGEISQVHLLATEYPEVDFIIPHLGSFADDWKAQLSFIDPLARYANMYTDTSGVRRHDILTQAYEQAGAHKILFGSDGPWLHPGVELEKINALKTTEEEYTLITSGNFLRLIGKKIMNPPNMMNPHVRKNTLEHNHSHIVREHRDPWLTNQTNGVF